MKFTDDPGRLKMLKTRLRVRAKAERARLPNREAAAGSLVRQFEDSPWGLLAAGAVVAGYWPIGSEIDCRPLLRRLRADGVTVALPAVETLNAALTFRVWDGSPPSATDRLGMRVPAPAAARVTPDIVLVPLLLIDPAGHRLGYGGGYYDRTLKVLRQMGRAVALGLAFDAQLTEPLPAGSDDMALDGLITETGWREFGKEADAAPDQGPHG